MKRNAFIVLCFCLSLTSAVYAQGVIVVHWPPPHRRPIPPPPPPPDFYPHALSIQSIRFETGIQSQVSKTRVTQIFRNDAPYVLEGTFMFPLPDEAAISDFVIYEGEKKIRGEILEKEKARQAYESIVREIRDPGLLEYAGKNLFQARIFPIPPRGEKKIELEYSQILKADAGLVRYIYPLGTGGRALKLPIHNVSGRINIKSPVPIRNIYSPTHTLATRRDGDSSASVSFETSEAKPTSDFQLYYSLSDKEFGLSLLAYRQPGESGYFLLLLAPKTEIRSADVSKKDIVFVIDVSGSMNDRGKIEKARDALKFGIRTLNEGDRFNIISFATEETPYTAALEVATAQNKERGIKYVEGLRAAGGTNIYDALTEALKKFSGSERPQYLVLLTDGLPTVGETDVNRILDRAKEFNKTSIRIFTFGVGYDVNTFLLDQLSAAHNGAPDYVAPEEDLEVKVSNFFEKVNFPVLSDITLEIPNLDMTELYPKHLPDIFKGTQITLLGRYQASGRFPVRIGGKYLNSNRSFNYPDQSFPKEASEADFLPRLWASRKVGYLLDQIRLHGETNEVKEEVVRLAKKYGFVTPYTSYLAADDTEMVRRRMNDRATRTGGNVMGVAGGVSGGTARDQSARTVYEAPAGMAIEARQLNAQTGAQAVSTSQALTQMKTAAQVSVGSVNTQVVGNKTFTLQDGVWIDSEWDATKKLPVVKLQFGSDEYFALLTREPALGKFLALGENMTLVYGGRVYEIRK